MNGFGSIEDTIPTDGQGSHILQTTSFKDSHPVGNVRRRYSQRHRVADQKQEFEQYLKYSDEMKNHRDTKLDPSFDLRFTKEGNEKGYYYVVWCWTEVVKCA